MQFIMISSIYFLPPERKKNLDDWDQIQMSNDLASQAKSDQWVVFSISALSLGSNPRHRNVF